LIEILLWGSLAAGLSFYLSFRTPSRWYGHYFIGVVIFYAAAAIWIRTREIRADSDGDQSIDDLLIMGFLSLAWLAAAACAIIGMATRGIVTLNCRLHRTSAPPSDARQSQPHQ
jgi:hypothetical protein